MKDFNQSIALLEPVIKLLMKLEKRTRQTDIPLKFLRSLGGKHPVLAKPVNIYHSEVLIECNIGDKFDRI